MIGKLTVVPCNPDAMEGFNRNSYYKAKVGDLTFTLALPASVKAIKSIRYSKKKKRFKVDLICESAGEQVVVTQPLNLAHKAKEWLGSGEVVDTLKSVTMWMLVGADEI